VEQALASIVLYPLFFTFTDLFIPTLCLNLAFYPLTGVKSNSRMITAVSTHAEIALPHLQRKVILAGNQRDKEKLANDKEEFPHL
jgi:hypothetical protein